MHGLMHVSCIKGGFGDVAAQIDQFDRKILALLQEDARLTNGDLSQRINLSPSQCSRRRQRLEEDGFIRGYKAVLDRDRLGFSLVNMVTVTLATHNRDNARRFAELVSRLPEVQEAHALTGEMDYILKVVTPDLKSLSEFVNDVLLPHESVQHVKTAIVLQTLKETTALPLGLEARVRAFFRPGGLDQRIELVRARAGAAIGEDRPCESRRAPRPGRRHSRRSSGR